MPHRDPPSRHASRPPMKVSSTSTVRDNRGRSARTVATRKRCSITHAVLYATPSVRAIVVADTPLFPPVISHAAASDTGNGVSTTPHPWHTYPSGQRNPTRSSAQADRR